MTRHVTDEAPPELNANSVEKDVGQTASAEGKGKDTGSSTSALARLQSSSNMLSRAVLSGSTISDGSEPSAGASVAAKAGGSRPINGQGESAHTAYRSVNGGLEAPGQSPGFRRTQDAPRASEDFEKFMNGHDKDPGFIIGHSKGKGIAEADLDEARDGSGVLELLSSADALEEVYSMSENDDSVDPQAADMLRKALFEAPGSRNVPWDHLLNFEPDFISTPKGDSNEAFNQLGTNDVDEAREMWVDQWRDVLSSYTDEVWGALEPLVVAARQEVEAAAGASDTVHKDNNLKASNGALQRLRMILAHVRGSS
ncbi:uncharacterized protein F5Z01DRAFT_637280 [Emericellopsis atlantica]|uniref:Uncharacterized protein n=1 Tax=Emericellopsis atlantica TaxID=2614577 RepID=A0A9P7ZKT5_9HYPO|nr:uncharacterized protein F5Z01DRAFT_637280 [Emericellopsis atlantica]KAG9253536.1 hypothetical protein F5Z01DRAFT_637280 [Emericellopsis atlantica]